MAARVEIEIEGVYRDLTDQYQEYREKKKKLLKGTRANADQDVDDEMKKMTMAPPIWLELVNKVKSDLAAIRDQEMKLARLHSRRMKEIDFHVRGSQKLDDQSHPLDAEIETVTQSIASLVRRCEGNIKRIALLGNDGNLPAAERTVRLNVMKTLTQKIASITNDYRERQKSYLLGLKEQSSFVRQFFPEDNSDQSGAPMLNAAFTEEQMRMLEEAEQTADQRTQQVARIAKSVNDLAQLMHEMQVLVVEQGSVLDRIDYNVEHALEDIKAGVKEVDSAEDYQKRDRACLIIAALISFIMIIAIVVIARASSSSGT